MIGAFHVKRTTKIIVVFEICFTRNMLYLRKSQVQVQNFYSVQSVVIELQSSDDLTEMNMTFESP